MINITVDLTGINARLDKMNDYFSPGKTENSKKVISRLTDKCVEIFQEHSLLRMDNNRPPNVRQAIRGKKLSISRYAKQFTKTLFIGEQLLGNNNIIIGIGINMPPGIIPPMEKKYGEHAGKFSAWIEQLGIYNFAGLQAHNIFYMRHYGTGAKSMLPGYIGKRLYPNNLNLIGPSGALLSPETVRYHMETALAAAKLGGQVVQTETKKIKARLVKRDKITGEIIKKEESTLELTKSKDEEASGKYAEIDYEEHPFLQIIVNQISEESLEDFFKGNFDNVKLSHGSDLLMWHSGVSPYDWFHDTNYGKAMRKPFNDDLVRISDMIVNSYGLLVRKI